MASMQRFMRGSNSFGTRYIDRLFQPSITFNANARYDDKVIEEILKLRDKRPLTYEQQAKDRSFLDRGFDMLLTPNYMIAGAVDGMVRDDKTVLEGLRGGARAGNPIGAGYEAGEVTFSDALRSAGWGDDAFWGSNFARGTIGFAMDILLDPTTYLTLGVGAIAKGTGRLASKATKTLTMLTEQFPEFAKGIKEAGAMTDELAEKIVMRANGLTSKMDLAKTADDIGKVGESPYKMSQTQFNQEVAEFKSKYNELIGVGRKGEGITLGVQNMPFGDFVAKKLNITSKPITLVKDSTLRKFSDSTGISSVYGATREAFYGSKIGSLLSRNAGLKRLAEIEPAKLYEYIGAVNKLQGKNLDKVARERHIKELGDTLLHLSPAEQKKIIKALENPNVWQKVTDVIRGSGTKAWENLQKEYQQTNEEILKEAKVMREMRDQYINASEDQLREYRKQLHTLDKPSMTVEQKNIVDLIDKDIKELISKKSAVQASVKQPKNYDNIIKDLEAELEQTSTLYNQMKGKVVEGVESPYLRMPSSEFAELLDGKIGNIKAVRRKREMTKADLTKLQQGGSPDEIANLTKLLKNVQLNADVSKNELREIVSEYLFGNKNAVPRNIDGDKLEALAHALKHTEDPYKTLHALSGEMGGKRVASSPEAFREVTSIIMEADDIEDALRMIVQRDSLITDEMIDIYKYLASKYNYGSIVAVRERITKLKKELRIDKDGRPALRNMTPEDYAKLDEFRSLSEMLVRRNAEYKSIMDIPTSAERIAHINKLRDEQMEEEMFDLLYGDVDRARITSEAVDDLSARQMDEYQGTQYDKKYDIEDMRRFDEAKTDGVALNSDADELARFRQTKNVRKYTADEVRAHSFDAIKAHILKIRQKGMYKRSLTPEAKKAIGTLKDLTTKYRSATFQYRLAKQNGATKEYLEKIRERASSIYDELATERVRVERETNLMSVIKQAKELDRSDVEFLSAQFQAGLFIQEKIFPYHEFGNLTSKQKNMLSGLSYSLTKKYVEKNGVPKASTLQEFRDFLEQEGVKKINKEVTRINKERAEVAQSTLVRDIVTYDSGVEIQVGEEVVRGVVRKITEMTEPIYRERVEIVRSTADEGTIETRLVKKPRTDKKGNPILGKDGKPIMREQLENYRVPPQITRTENVIREKIGEQPLGVYKYDVELPDGTIKQVEAKDIVGTYVDDLHFEKQLLPYHTDEEIKNVVESMEKLKNRIRGMKGAKTKQEKRLGALNRSADEKIAKLDAQIADLLEFKTKEEDLYKEMANIEKTNEEALQTLQQNAVMFGKKADEYDEAYRNLMERYNKVEKALDNDELFEALIKLDMGEDGYAEFYQNSWQHHQSGELVLDRLEDWDKHLVDITKKLRHDFISAGLDEVSVGKLDKGALETMVDRYFPRSLSKEGKEFFDKNPELIEKYKSVAREYGFGKEFTPFSKARSDETRYKSIFELNDEMQKELGIRVFEENLGQAYINRMLTSTDLVYDQRAMQDVMYRFGHGLEKGIMKGYEAVINYGQLKDFVRKEAIVLTKEVFGDEKVAKEVFDAEFQKQGRQIIESFGLNPKILDGETTPLIKIDMDIYEKMNKSGAGHLARQMNLMTIDRANQARQLIMERDESRMLQLYDKFMTFFKLNQTTVMPAFHVRNHIGAMFVGWLGVGREALSISSQKTAFEALKAYGKNTDLRKLKPIVPDEFGGKTYYWDEVMELANTHRVIDEGFMMKDFASHSYSDGTRIIPGKFDPFNTKEFLPYKIGSKVATYSDNINRLVQFSALLKQGKTPLEASEVVRKYMFDYSDLTTFEKRWMKRIFPYYTYMRKNLPMMSNEFLDNPEKMQLVAKLHNNLTEGMLSEEEQVSEDYKLGFAQDWIQMPFGLNSMTGKEPVLANPNLPYMQLRDIPTNGSIEDTFRTFAGQSAPMLKVPFELATNWNLFFDSPITTPDGDQISPKVLHVMSQLSAFNAVSQFVTSATLDDKMLSLLNTGTGIKMTTYDLEGAKERYFEEMYNQQFELNLKTMIGSGVRFASGLVDNVRTDISDMAIQLYGKPYDAFEAEGVLAPISDKSYNRLPESERKQYTFDEHTKSYIHNRAIEFEREQYEKSGIMKKFGWMLIKDDGFDKAVVSVDKVTDGDTFVARQGDKTFDVRLLLVDTPESKGDYKDNPQAYGVEASEYTTDLILGKDVKLYLDEKTTYGRRLAFVEVGGKSVQEELVKEGYAKVRQYDEKYTDEAEELYNLEDEAYKKRKGVWSIDGNAVPRSNTGYQR